MIEAIERTDGIVYVHEGSCRFGLSACLATVRSAPPVRFVHIKVDTRKAVGCELMSAIGHELQHALEVLGNPKVIDDQTLAHFYIREGSTGDDNRLETESAVRAGLQVEKELQRARCAGADPHWPREPQLSLIGRSLWPGTCVAMPHRAEAS